MKIKNISKIPIEVYDGNRFTRIMPGESKEVDGETVRRRKLVERGLVVIDVPAKPQATEQAMPGPARRYPSRIELDDSDA